MHQLNDILLVDDDPIFLTLAELAIRKERPDAEIHRAMNGEEAMEFLETKKVDLIFLDLNMPVMNGWEFLDNRVSSGRMDDRIYVLTSSIDPSDQKKAVEHPLVVKMLEKPLRREVILELLC